MESTSDSIEIYETIAEDIRKEEEEQKQTSEDD